MKQLNPPVLNKVKKPDLWRRITWLLAVCLMWMVCWPATSQLAPQTTVNAVLGDLSYVERFGHPPTAETDENTRIRTHLAYVEKLLKSQVPDSVPRSLYPRRKYMLNLLHSYQVQGVYPRQTAFKGRQPHFIDEQGRLCAVGYLVERTDGRDLAEKINQQDSYAYVPDMQLPELKAWQEKSGLTLQELAMIQPRYAGDVDWRASLPNYDQVMLFALILQTGLLIFHIGAEEWLSKEAYQSIQAADIITTILTALFHLELIIFSMVYTPEPKLSSLPVLLAATGALTIPNLVLLDQVGIWAHQPDQQIKLGLFQTPDQQASWGFQAQLSF